MPVSQTSRPHAADPFNEPPEAFLTLTLELED